MAQSGESNDRIPRSIKQQKKISGPAGNLFYCSGFLIIEFTSQTGLHKSSYLVLRKAFAEEICELCDRGFGGHTAAADRGDNKT